MWLVKLICVFLLGSLMVEAASSTRKLGGVIRDQSPNTMRSASGGSCGTANRSRDGTAMGFWGTDFQLPSDSYTNNEKGLCGDECNNGNYKSGCGRLGLDQTPVYRYQGQSPGNNIRSQTSFNHWFHTTAQNVRIDYDIPLSQTSTPNVYSYIDNSFFPIDGKGWGDEAWNSDDSNNNNRRKHNFAFCLEAHTRFGYRGGEVFNFAGDDDVWVYINDYLVIDLGSLHTKESKSLSLDNLEFLVKGTNYRLDFFYCERHTTQSNLELTTSIQFYCAYDDWCGQCEGNGQSCCTQEILDTTCNDNDACTVDYCPVKDRPTKANCQHVPRNCTPPDACHSAKCDKKDGCVFTPLVCNDRDPCTIDSCGANGCKYDVNTCDDGDPCTNDYCQAGEGCKHTTRVCNDNDECTIDTCNSNTAAGCVFTRRTCNDNSKCTRDTCESNKPGGCVYTNLCNDNDRCTTDTCNPAQGCSNTPIKCGNGEKCLDSTCNPNTGTCMSQPVICADRDACTITSCSNSSGCLYTPRDCNDGKACTIDRCDLRTGCYYTPVNCNDGNACTTDSCSNSTGCLYKDVNLDDKDACTLDFCNNATGIYRTDVKCNDNDDCTDDSCSKSAGCQYKKKTCTGDPCSTVGCNKVGGCFVTPIPGCFGCKSGPNGGGNAIVCNTTDKCYPKSCNYEQGGCKNTTVNCDDGNACTDDSCSNGECFNPDKVCPPPTNQCQLVKCDTVKGCVYSNKTCDDFDPCTTDSCSPSNGACVFTRVSGFCTSCGTSACRYTDLCNPSVCNTTTNKCQETPVDCSDANECTKDKCNVVNNATKCSYTPVTCADSGDLCNPNVCDKQKGCQKAPVTCRDADVCTEDMCVVSDVGGSPAAGCFFSVKTCNNTDPCHPFVCNALGTCEEVPVVCRDEDPCTNDKCVVKDGLATCAFDPVVCPTDQCGPQMCNSTNGQCYTFKEDCNDGNPCTDDFATCNGTNTVCNYTSNTLCDDKDACTNDLCDSSNKSAPCMYSNVTCFSPSICHAPIGCDSQVGCLFQPLVCPGQFNVCKIASCDPRAGGCIAEDKVCTTRDDNCFRAECNWKTTKTGQEPCREIKLSNWGKRMSGATTCALKWNAAARNAAIGAGAAAGIAIGGAAAVGFLGYGGKKGYDVWKNFQDQKMNNVQNNPLYEESGGQTDNPLYRHSTTI